MTTRLHLRVYRDKHLALEALEKMAKDNPHMTLFKASFTLSLGEDRFMFSYPLDFSGWGWCGYQARTLYIDEGLSDEQKRYLKTRLRGY